MTDDALIAEVLPLSKQSTERLRGWINALRMVKDIPGDVVECGVYKGASIIVARKILPDRVCWLYDTFAGMTKPDADIDRNRGGRPAIVSYQERKRQGIKWAAASLLEVKEILTAHDVMNTDYLRFVVGNVLETLNQPPLPERIAILRLDTDWYASTKIELERLWPRLVTGGILVVDDYGHWQGAKRAVDEYFSDKIIKWHNLDYSCIATTKED